MSKEKKVVAGILLTSAASSKSLTANGLFQNAIYLYNLLKKTKRIEPLLVYIPESLADTDETKQIFGHTAYNISLFYETYHLSVILEVGATLSDIMAERLRSAGTKIAFVGYGNLYIINQEVTCFGHLPPSELRENFANHNILTEIVERDAVWMSPHFAWQKDYYKHRFNAKRAHVCPYVWDTEILDKRYSESGLYQDKEHVFHRGNPANKNVFSTEPNINILKTSLFPFQAFSTAYENAGDEIGNLYLYGSYHLAVENKNLISYFKYFSSLKDGKVKFLKRHQLPSITNDAQIMFHHHFQNGLNYTLLEAARLRLPVVHNSEFMPELGYYYRGANLTDAAKQIELAMGHEDRDDLEQYNLECQKVIQKFSINNIDNIIGYQTLIANLLDSSIEPVLPEYIVGLEQKINHGDGYISPLG